MRSIKERPIVFVLPLPILRITPVPHHPRHTTRVVDHHRVQRESSNRFILVQISTANVLSPELLVHLLEAVRIVPRLLCTPSARQIHRVETRLGYLQKLQRCFLIHRDLRYFLEQLHKSVLSAPPVEHIDLLYQRPLAILQTLVYLLGLLHLTDP